MSSMPMYTVHETGEVIVRRCKHTLHDIRRWRRLGSCCGPVLQQLIVFESDDHQTRYIYRNQSESKELAELEPKPKHTLMIMQCSEVSI